MLHPLALALLAAPADAAYPPPDQLPVIAELPDPFVRADGTRVARREDWPAQRAYLAGLIQHYAYGELPPAPGNVCAVDVADEPAELPGTRRQGLTLVMGPDDRVRCRVRVTQPVGDGPFPAIVNGDLCWDKLTPETVAEVVRRGYLLVQFDRTDFAPDAADRSRGVYPAYPGYDGGAIAAWAWGFHRVVDWLLTRPDVDASRITVTGHSRGGKAALLAGALDERVALTAPNNSGCMGAGCLRVLHGECETLARITTVFPFWFHPRLAEFAEQVERLPFDLHTLKALAAPRRLISTEALGDIWANPPGSELTHQAAKRVYEFLGVPDRIAIVFREGGHAHNLQDFQALMDYEG